MEKYTTVDEFIKALDGKQKGQVVQLRSIIKGAHPELIEHIKWNSPSYILNGEDRITFSVRPGHPIAIILHMGALRPEDKNGTPIMGDPSGLIEWKSNIRGAILFDDAGDIEVKKLQFVAIVDQWLKIDS